MNREFSHLTFVVRDITETLGAYEQFLEMTTEDGIDEQLADGRVATIPISGIRLEFIEPDPTVESPFRRFLSERGEGLISYCIVIENFDEEIARLKERGATLEEATQDELFPDHSLRIAWILPEERLGCRVELVDKDSLPPDELDTIASSD